MNPLNIERVTHVKALLNEVAAIPDREDLIGKLNPEKIAVTIRVMDYLYIHSSYFFQFPKFKKIVRDKLISFRDENGWEEADVYLDKLFPSKLKPIAFTWSSKHIRKSLSKTQYVYNFECSGHFKLSLPSNRFPTPEPPELSLEYILSEISRAIQMVMCKLVLRCSKNVRAFQLCDSVIDLCYPDSNMSKLKRECSKLLHMRCFSRRIANKLKAGFNPYIIPQDLAIPIVNHLDSIKD